ncbi:MAG: enoyl-CoA hydratase/isomerase family protein [Polyangiaceae bacterium]|nr:enoyl-CoA hydratase/isomerase family protein [Polyangiaceae bacterium]
MLQRSYQALLVENVGGIVTITMNRPERKNPLGPRMVNELLYALDDANESSEVRAIVLTGAGSAFSAGADLADFAAAGDDSALPFRGGFKELLLRFTALGKPTIARVPGLALGGGLGLVASCDFAVASESATLGTPEIKRGLFPMMIMAVLQRVVPRRKLMNMMLLGERLSAEEGLEIGLLSHVVPDAELDAAVASLAEKLASQSPTAMRMGLGAFHRQADQTLAEALPELEQQLGAILGTEDAREGLAAFMQKREPRWTGR